MQKDKISIVLLFVSAQNAKRKTNGLDLSLFFQERASIQTPNEIRMAKIFTDVDKYMFSAMKTF